MRKFALAALLWWPICAAAFAAEHGVPGSKPVATIAIPDDWTTSDLGGGFEATSSDGAVYVAVEETGSDSIKECIDAVATYLKRKGVAVTEDSRKQRERMLGNMDIVDIFWDGKDEKGAVKVGLSIVAVTKTQGLLVISWALPANEKKRAETVAALVKSIREA